MEETIPRTMRQAVLEKPGEPLRIRRTPVPAVGDDDALIEIGVATVCSLTDLNTIRGTHPPHGSGVRGMLPHDLRVAAGKEDEFQACYPRRRFPEPAFPAAMGHEASGRVVALGPRANNADSLVFPDRPLAVGDRVTTYKISGAYGEYSALSSENIVHVPGDVGDAEASLLEPMIATYNCIKRCFSIRDSDTAVVLGQGCQGLLATQILRALGARHVIVSEPSAFKRRTALDLGADVAIDPGTTNVVHEVERITSGRGADIVVECVGRQATVQLIPYLVRRGGIVAQIGAVTEPVNFDYGYVHFKHFIIVGSDYFPHLRSLSDQVAQLLALMTSGDIRLSPLITHRFALADIDEVFAMIRRAPAEMIKVAIDMR